MARYVIDASALLAFVLSGENRQADEFWSGLNPDDQLIGAQILLPECASVIREQVFLTRTSSDSGQAALADALAFRIRVNTDRRQFTRAMELSALTGRRRAYDMQYLAVAETEGAELVTADRGLRQAAIEINHPVRFLG